MFEDRIDTFRLVSDVHQSILGSCNGLLILHQLFSRLFCCLPHSIYKELDPPDISPAVLCRPKEIEIFILIVIQILGQAY